MTLSEYLNPERPVERLDSGVVKLQENEVTVWTNTAAKCRVATIKLFDKHYQYRTSTLNSKTLYAIDERGKPYKASVFSLDF